MTLYFDTDPAWIDAIRSWAAGEPEVIEVWVFGSRASGIRRDKAERTEAPDLDLAVLSGSGQEVIASEHEGHFIAYAEQWRAALRRVLPIDIDLVSSEDDYFDKSTAVAIYRRP